MKNILKRCLVAVFSAVYVIGSVAVSAAPMVDEPFEYVQPDGTKVVYYAYGDEFYSFIGDNEGYLLQETADGTLVYATNDGSAPVVYTGNGTRPENAVNGYDAKPAQSAEMSLLNEAEPMLATTAPVLENRKLLVVAVEYNDSVFDATKFPDSLLYDKHFSYTAENGSVADYYTEVSDGKFTFVPAFKTTDSYITDTDGDAKYGVLYDGVLKIKFNKNHPNPNSSSPAQSQQQMAEDILTAIDPYIDFSVYDVDNSGKIERDELVFMLVISGGERSITGASTKTVHAHRSYIPSSTKICDGVDVRTGGYTMVGAMQSGTRPLGIGTPCHELGHNLGLPDLYNTAGGSDFTDMGYASLMCSGGHGRNAEGVIDYCPPHIDGWSRYYLGWYDADDFLEIDETYTGEIKIEAVTSDYPDAYKLVKINTTADPDEYYILEYRKDEGYDYGLNTHARGVNYGEGFKNGIAIYQVNDPNIGKYNQYECGVRLLFTGRQRTYENSKFVGTALDSYYSFYNAAQPFWSCDGDKLPFFGNISYPDNRLSTANGNATSSGVQIEFLTGSDADVAKIRVGGLTSNVAVGRTSSDTGERLYVFNHTSSSRNYNIYAAQYDGDRLTSVFKLASGTVNPNSFGRAGSGIDPKLVKGQKYKLFNMNFSNMIPYSNSVSYTGSGSN